MVVSQLLDSIKREVKLSGTGELDATILEIVNEETVKYAAKNRYAQFFVKDDQLLLEAGTSAVDLPVDLQHFLRDTVRYFTADEDTSEGRELKLYDKRRSQQGGLPVQYVRQSSQLLLTPYDEISSGDYLLIDYYAYPASLGLDDIFPLPNLENTIRQEVMARCCVFTDIKRFPMYKAQAKDAYIANLSVT
jgi:hypothetical protein